MNNGLGANISKSGLVTPEYVQQQIANKLNVSGGNDSLTGSEVALLGVDPLGNPVRQTGDVASVVQRVDLSLELQEEILSYEPVTSVSIISAASIFSGWGYAIGSPQNIRSVEFYIYAFDNALLPTLMTIRLRSVNYLGTVLAEVVNIAISPAYNTLTKYTVTLSSELVNVSDDELWFEYLTNGRTAIYATASSLPFQDPPYPRTRYATNANSSGVTQANNSTQINGYIKVNYFNRFYTKPTGDFTSEVRKSLDTTEIIHPDFVYTLATQETNLYFDTIVKTTINRRLLEFKVTGSDPAGTLWEKFYRNDKTKTATYFGTLNVIRDNVLQASKDLEIKVATAGSGSGVTRKVLFIGDSNTASNVYPTTVYDDLQTFNGGVGLKVTLVGTQGSGAYKHEGISGKTFSFFNSDVSSPFVFGGVFDFAQYLSTNAITIAANDWVCFMLGTNDLFSITSTLSTVITQMKADLANMISDIQSAVPGIRICIAMTMPPAPSQDAWAYLGTLPYISRTQYLKNLYTWWSELITTYDTAAQRALGIYLLGTHAVLDTENCYTKVSTSPNARLTNSFSQDQTSPGNQIFTGGTSANLTISNNSNYIKITSVFKNGAILRSTTDYSYSDTGKTVTLGVAPIVSDVIIVNYISGYSLVNSNTVHPSTQGLNQIADSFKALFKFYV